GRGRPAGRPPGGGHARAGADGDRAPAAAEAARPAGRPRARAAGGASGDARAGRPPAGGGPHAARGGQRAGAHQRPHVGRWLGRLLFVVALVRAIVAGYPSATGVALLAGARMGPAGPTPPGWLHVQRDAGGVPYIADAEGRRVVLRGATAAGLLDYWSGPDTSAATPAPFYPIAPAAYENGCPANSSTIRVPPLCRDDLDQMRALGFDALRLPL